MSNKRPLLRQRKRAVFLLKLSEIKVCSFAGCEGKLRG